jgi:NADH-quinone oxidoreductase subunit L
MDAHKGAMIASTVVGIVGISVAFLLHFAGRTTAATSKADGLLPVVGRLAVWAQGKWYVDEFYEAVIRKPLWVLTTIFHLVDQFLIDGLVDLFGKLPKALGQSLRPSQSGELHGYAVGMAGGIAVLLLIVIFVAN